MKKKTLCLIQKTKYVKGISQIVPPSGDNLVVEFNVVARKKNRVYGLSRSFMLASIRYSFICETDYIRRSSKNPEGIRRTSSYNPHYIPMHKDHALYCFFSVCPFTLNVSKNSSEIVYRLIWSNLNLVLYPIVIAQ